jgi:TfoX/Sxy family transcriptional regulator of competence genes
LAYDETAASRVRRVLSRRARVVEKRLMGGLAFLVNGSMCCSVGRDGLLVRVGPEERERALVRPHVTPMKLGGRTMSGFVRVAPAGFRTDASLATWIARGIEAGSAARRTRPRR